MKLIIDIPEWKYKSICEGIEASKRCGVVGIDPDIHEAIYNGKPYEELQDDLISRSALKIAIREATYGFEEIPIRADRLIALIDNSPTVATNKDFYKEDKSNPINRSDLFQ